MDYNYTSASNGLLSSNGLKKKKGNGDNIINKIEDPQAFAEHFVSVYFENILMRKDYTMFRAFTMFKFNDVVYQNHTLIEFLSLMATNDIAFEKVDVMASGSRRFDMIMIGTINNKFFSQYFMLNHEKDDIWYIKSSIISISQKKVYKFI